VVGLGVDHSHFTPRDRSAGRRILGAAPSSLIMLYVGGMDLYHDLAPLLEVLAEGLIADLELHLVGDGEYRQRYEALARASGAAVTFHGRIDHAQIPHVIAGADICLAPYNTEAFPGGEVYFSTLKIPEYMACERPVVSVPSGPISRLIQDGATGFLIANQKEAWTGFLKRLPTREVLADMGKAAAASVADMSWRKTALGYLTVAGLAPQGSDR
jgi:glycosyltransferase involved in cell wall biosynthesis